MATQVLEPIGIAENEEEQVRTLRLTMASGEAVLMGPDGQRHPIPDDVHALFLRVLDFLQAGNAIAILPYTQEMTTQDAGKLLGMSRQYLVRLLDAGEIPHHKVGTHRRIYLKDLLEFKKTRDRKRATALSELARLSMEAGLYD